MAPRHTESFTIVILEAWIAGSPMIAITANQSRGIWH